MFYYLYQITNLVNGKIYVGVHKTKNLDDGYMGSGKILKNAINKHGIESFRKDILEFFENRELMYVRESEIVTEEFLARDDVYNLRRGGSGGFDWINNSGLNGSDKGVEKRTELLKTDWKEEWKKSHQIGITKRVQYDKENKLGLWSPEYVSPFNSIELQHELMERARRANLGSTFINNGKINKKIKKNESIPEGWVKGRIRT